MQVIQNILRFLAARAAIPLYLGVFHLFWIALTIAATVTLCILWKKGIIKDSKHTIFVSALILIVLGIYKQLVLNVDYSPTLALNFDWNSIPLSLSSLALAIGIFSGMSSGNINKNFVSYLPVFGFMTGLVGMLNPFSFGEVIGLNVYTMLCYGWMIAISVFILYTNQVDIEIKTFWRGVPVLFLGVGLAVTLNEVVHAFVPSQPYINLFSISRFHESDVPVYSWIHNSFLASGGEFTIIEYVIAIVLYIAIISLAALAIFGVLLLIKKLTTTNFDAEYEDTTAQKSRVTKREQELINKLDALEKKVANKSNNPFMIHYFKNLRVNFGDNLRGSCGYVALAMILSYFDTVLNDKIIPENYDRPSNNFYASPGIGKDVPNADVNKWNYDQYKAFIDQKKNTYLHARFLDIAHNQDRVRDKKHDFHFGSIPEDIRKVFDEYIKNVANISPKYCAVDEFMMTVNDKKVSTDYVIGSKLSIINHDNRTIYDATRRINTYVKDDIYDQSFRAIQFVSEEIKKFAINTIREKGIPVWISVGRLTDEIDPSDRSKIRLGIQGGHAIVAYAVTDNNELICHYGWPTIANDVENSPFEEKNPYTCKLAMDGDSDGKYNLYMGALAISFPDMPHVHTNNYEISIGGKTYFYCPDGTHTNANGEVVVSNENWLLSINDKDKCTIEGYKGNIITKDSTLTIPKEFKPYEVIAIANEAFKAQSFIRAVVIPKDISVIGNNAFEKCRSLEHVTLTDDVKFIGDEAFADCSSLVTIEFDGSIEKWQRIKKGKGWNARTGNYTIYCTNGTIKKANNTFNTSFQ